jgi:hypothetical protein
MFNKGSHSQKEKKLYSLHGQISVYLAFSLTKFDQLYRKNVGVFMTQN